MEPISSGLNVRQIVHKICFVFSKLSGFTKGISVYVSYLIINDILNNNLPYVQSGCWFIQSNTSILHSSNNFYVQLGFNNFNCHCPIWVTSGKFWLSFSCIKWHQMKDIASIKYLSICSAKWSLILLKSKELNWYGRLDKTTFCSKEREINRYGGQCRRLIWS